MPGCLLLTSIQCGHARALKRVTQLKKILINIQWDTSRSINRAYNQLETRTSAVVACGSFGKFKKNGPGVYLDPVFICTVKYANQHKRVLHYCIISNLFLDSVSIADDQGNISEL